MYYIIQVCCYDCMKFLNFRICPHDDYKKFILDFFNYKDSCFIIYNSNKVIDILEF